jgi:hypothetical protein
MRIVVVAILGTVLTACASAGPSSAPEAASTTAALAEADAQTLTTAVLRPGDPGYRDERICRREPVTGTRLTRARCHSRYDWARMAGAATETMRDILSQPTACLEGDQCKD